MKMWKVVARIGICDFPMSCLQHVLGLIAILYLRDPLLPTNALMQPPANCRLTDADYKSQLSLHMAEALALAKANVEHAQKQQ